MRMRSTPSSAESLVSLELIATVILTRAACCRHAAVAETDGLATGILNRLTNCKTQGGHASNVVGGHDWAHKVPTNKEKNSLVTETHCGSQGSSRNSGSKNKNCNAKKNHKYSCPNANKNNCCCHCHCNNKMNSRWPAKSNVNPVGNHANDNAGNYANDNAGSLDDVGAIGDIAAVCLTRAADCRHAAAAGTVGLAIVVLTCIVHCSV